MSNPDSKRTVPCPNCRKPVEWVQANLFRPFCSERCKLIDLGAWANEDYTVEAEDNPVYHNSRDSI